MKRKSNNMTRNKKKYKTMPKKISKAKSKTTKPMLKVYNNKITKLKHKKGIRRPNTTNSKEIYKNKNIDSNIPYKILKKSSKNINKTYKRKYLNPNKFSKDRKLSGTR